MANNALSFNRFTALPANIAEFGSTPEELQAQKGTPDPNPVLSPMPEVRVPEARLALAPGGSDNMRVGRPIEPNQNPFEGARKLVDLADKAIAKLDQPVLEHIQPVIDESADPNSANMKQSLRCIYGMREQTRDLATWARQAEYQIVSNARG